MSKISWPYVAILQKEFSSLQTVTKLICHFHSPAAESLGAKAVVLQVCPPKNRIPGAQTQAAEQLAVRMEFAGRGH